MNFLYATNTQAYQQKTKKIFVVENLFIIGSATGFVPKKLDRSSFLTTHLDSTFHRGQIDRCDVTKFNVRIGFENRFLFFAKSQQLVDQLLDLLGRRVLDELRPVARVACRQVVKSLVNRIFKDSCLDIIMTIKGIHGVCHCNISL
jgi:hypothetical protein